ncbi:alcohol-forming fatty acyl-CoA reductase-like [Chenopodium quinoa]|uniref:alcohol-forming fatty acyl-CoA reductase-like n=1 Tax=Chenopodium quinoa TaxID=63459 RepID=UPI000B772A06|nr:alcohol-forming fatty acyl-CoA reductase-like [Chenopodium quinoa]
MDFGNIIEFLGNKTILVTGATGFIAKILVEKILRIQPDVKKLYLLVRARDAQAADARLQDEILGKELFKVLKEKLGSNFESFVSEKITVVAGDTSYENLGLTAEQMKDMYEDIDIVINVAATTKFEERYDVALGVNTLGPKHVVNFAKSCAKIQLLIHVSTAYVCGEKAGIISESPYVMGETLNGVTGLDIESEKKLAEQTLSNLKSSDLPEKIIRQKMKNLGVQRAKFYGWPNTYVFTKAMGEMLVGQLRGDLPVIIMRPTIVCSTLQEPFPGWVEGCRTIDSVAVTYGKGSLSLFLADKSSVLDLIPADMFVNSMIVAMKAHVNQPSLTVYQVGSSYRNPVSFKELHEFHYHYFTKNPWTNREGSLVKIGKGVVLSNILIFEMILFMWQFVVQMILIIATRMGRSDLQRTLFNFDKKLKIAMKLVDLYKPYLFFKGIFADANTEKLFITARENGLNEDVFNFDPIGINWKDYFINVHLPSIVKYLF